MDFKIHNLIKNAKSTPTLSKFLTIDEQKTLVNNDLNIIFSNSYEGEERKRAFLYKKGLDIIPNFNISYLKIITKNNLKHPDILGALLGLGITREVIGDIIIGDEIIVIVAGEIEKYVIENLQLINKYKVEVKKINDITISNDNSYFNKDIIISSMRLDGIISKTLNLSREKAQELIKMKAVKINGKITLDNDYICDCDDCISITRFGRIIVRNQIRKTKKDKIVLNIERTKTKGE